MNKVRIGIVGYGNIGRGVEAAIWRNPDCEMAGVFTRRDPATVKITTEGGKVYPVSELAAYKDDIDVCIICGGSATDLPKQTPELAKLFNVVDSFDTHARIPEHFANVDAAAKESGHVGIISVGWDPGMFSLNRLYGNCVLGMWREPGTFGCDPSRRRRAGCEAVHRTGRIGGRSSTKRGESGADGQTEAYKRVLCRGKRRSGPGADRA